MLITRESASFDNAATRQDAEELSARILAMVRSFQRQASDRRKWLERLSDDARDYADKFSLCGEFDNFMEKWDLGGRLRPWVADVSISFVVPVEITAARNESDARGEITQAMVDDAAIRFINDTLSSGDWEIDEIREN